MIETIVIGKLRKGGKDELLADRSVPYPQKLKLYQEHGSVSDKYSEVRLVALDPMKRNLQPKTTAAAETEAKALAEAKAADEAKAKEKA